MSKKSSVGLPVALIQMAMSPDPKKNLPTAIDRITAAAKQGAKLVCLPELFRSLYFCQKEDYQCFDLAEPIPGPTTDLLAKTAKKLKITLVSSHFEQRTGGLYHNTAVVFGPDGSILGTYRKMHIPDDPGFSEKFYFAPGDTGFLPIQTPVGKLGVLVCWDQWYPEAARLMALRGARSSFIPPPSVWPGPSHGNFTKCNAAPGRRCSAVTPSPTGSLSSPSTGPAGRIISIFGELPSPATPLAKFWPRPPRTRTRSSALIWISMKSVSPASTGPFCAIAGSMPMTA